MEKSLTIFTKRKSFRPAIENIILIVFVVWIILIEFINSYNSPKDELLSAISVFLVIITMFYTLVLITANLFRHEWLNGKLGGKLVLGEEQISLGGTIYKISEIDEIEIDSDDIRGSYANTSRQFKPRRSNGVKNYIKLRLTNGQTVECFFLQTKQERIQIFSDVIRNYYRFGRIARENYMNIINDE